jgi:hypothetical protein
LHSAPPNAVGSGISTQAINISLLWSEGFKSLRRGGTDDLMTRDKSDLRAYAFK